MEHDRLTSKMLPGEKIILRQGDLVEQWLIKGLPHTFPAQSFNCYSRSLIDSIKIFPHPHISQSAECAPDRSMQLEAVLQGNIIAIDQCMGCYREHPLGIIKSLHLNISKIRNIINNEDEVKNFIAERIIPWKKVLFTGDFKSILNIGTTV